ncbi:MAG: TonB-dependent receptor [Bryobacteraceae bacterium]|jgi:hypothetical protein
MSVRVNLILGLTILTVAACAQTQRGQIVGRVTDTSGAVVPRAKVEVTNPATGVKAQTETNAEGLYTIPYLQYGSYRLTITAQGFAPYTFSGVEIATATTTTVNATLELAAVTDQVTVQASAIVLEANTSTVGTAVEEKLKSDVPNLVSGGMRNASSYIYLSPAVNPRGQLTLGGGRTNSAEALLDGQSLDIRSRFMGFQAGGMPSVEAIGEYKMLTNSVAAEYGRSSGAMTTFAAKSGTNKFHGVAYEYLRNTDLNARAWASAKRDISKQNEFGFAGGGPVILPRIYNGTNKTFFWANITGYKLRSEASSKVLTMPTEAMRKGDFSASDINPIYDPTDLYTNASGQTLRSQYSYGGKLNVIDPSRVSPVSKFFLDQLPLPTMAGSFNNFVGTSRNATNSWDFSLKMDHYLSARSRISGFYQYTHPNTASGNVLGDLFGAKDIWHVHRPRLDWTYNIKPNLINQMLFGVTRYFDGLASNNNGQNLGQKAGIRGTYDPNCPEIWFPQPDWYICGNTTLGGHPIDSKGNLITTFNDSLMWNFGKHTVKTGIQLNRWNENFRTLGSISHNSSTGEYAFYDSGTANTTGTGGNQWASFVLGYPTVVTMYAPADFGFRQAYYGLFVQDDWKVSRRLTINAGLRWDLNVPYSEVHGLVTSVDLNQPNPGAGNLPGALTFYGSGSGRNGNNRPGEIHWKNFGPRLGLAYQINSKTVFRAFAGLVYQGVQTCNLEWADHTGFQGGGSPTANPNPYGLYYSWDTPYPQNVLGTIPNFDPSFRNGQATTMQSESGLGLAPVLYMWSGGFQREIKGNILLDATYLANNVKHGTDKMGLDVLNPKYWSLGSLLNLPLNSPQVQALGFTAPYPGFNQSLPLYRALIPYPQFNGLTDNASSWTASTYNAAIFKVQKRFSAGLTFLTNYTLAKYIATTFSSPGQYGAAPRDPYNFRLSKALYRYDMPQRLVLSYSYELPFGPGKRFGSGSGRVGKQLLSGWIISGIHQYQAGTPLQSSGALATSIPTVSSMSDRVAGVPLRSNIACSEMQFGNPARNYLLNAGNPTQATRTGRPLAYQSEGAYGFGNAALVDPQARQCWTLNEDISATKTFYVRERLQIRFGLEGFNLLNRHTWATSDSQAITGANYGEITPLQFNGPRQMQVKLRVEF